MTWWYRWLCRLSGVLGAVCEYPARGRGRPRRPPRMRVRPRPSGAPPRGGVAGRGSAGRARSGRAGGCYGYRPRGPRLGWRRWGRSWRERESLPPRRLGPGCRESSRTARPGGSLTC